MFEHIYVTVNPNKRVVCRISHRLVNIGRCRDRYLCLRLILPHIHQIVLDTSHFILFIYFLLLMLLVGCCCRQYFFLILFRRRFVINRTRFVCACFAVNTFDRYKAMIVENGVIQSIPFSLFTASLSLVCFSIYFSFCKLVNHIALPCRRRCIPHVWVPSYLRKHTDTSTIFYLFILSIWIIMVDLIICVCVCLFCLFVWCSIYKTHTGNI